MSIRVGEVSELGIESNRISGFYTEHWPRGIALSMPSFYEWQFTRSPADHGLDHCMVAIDDSSSELLGVMGVNKRGFFLEGLEQKGAELTTWVVDSKHIGKGIGTRIVKAIQDRYDVVVGMGVSDMALPIYMRSGFRLVRAIPRYVRVYDFEKIKSYAKYTMLGEKMALKWLITDTQEYKIEAPSKKNLGRVEDVMKREYNHSSRSYDYLQWRYSEHPTFQYNQYLIRKGGAGCFVCLRLEESLEDIKILHVLDFFGDQADMKAAISFINDFCAKNSVHLADFYCTSTRITSQFIDSGWFSIIDDECFQFPHLFHPVEIRKPPTTSLIYWSRENFANMADIGKLYIAKGDADLDRPTLETYRIKADESLGE